MKGKPKYKLGQTVVFKFPEDINSKEGIIYIIDANGTWDFPNEVCYDILVLNDTYKVGIRQSDGTTIEEERQGECLNKHIPERLILYGKKTKRVRQSTD